MANCQYWFERSVLPAQLNDTVVVLIPNKELPDTMKDLRPISFCNVTYKIYSKVLANRLKKTLLDIISDL